MPRFNTEEQFKFLISCIRFSNNGRIDFVEVARECGIVSKGAAAKRYERMMKAHSIGVDMSTADGSSGDVAATPRKKRKRTQTDTEETGETGGEKGPEAAIDNAGDEHDDGEESGEIKSEPGRPDSHEDYAYDGANDDRLDNSGIHQQAASMSESTFDEITMVAPAATYIKEEPQ